LNIIIIQYLQTIQSVVLGVKLDFFYHFKTKWTEGENFECCSNLKDKNQIQINGRWNNVILLKEK